MSKMHVSRYIDKSEDGEQLIFDVADGTSEESGSDLQAAIADLTERVASLEAVIGTLMNDNTIDDSQNVQQG